MRHMDIVRAWFVMLVALGLSIACFLLVESTLLSPRGSFGPTVLQAQVPLASVLAILGALAVGTVIALGIGRMFNTSTGLLVLGIGLGWLALQLQPVQEILLNGSMELVALEGLAWAILLLIIVTLAVRCCGALVVPMLDQDEPAPDWATSPEALRMAAAGAAVLPVVWLIAQSPMKGQVLAATIFGSIAAGLLGRLVAPTVQPMLLFASVCVFGALGQWVAGTSIPAAELQGAVSAGTLPHIVLPLPIDYAAGSLIGIPLGLAWGGSFLSKDTPGAGDREFNESSSAT